MVVGKLGTVATSEHVKGYRKGLEESDLHKFKL